MRPYLRAANVTWSGLDLKDVKSMNFTDTEMETYRLCSGDIVVNEASGSPSEVGKPAMFRGEIEDCGFQNHLIRLRTKLIETEFLFYFLMNNALSGDYVSQSQGVGINHLGKMKLASWMTPVPSTGEQQRIVEILDEQFSRLDAALASVQVVREKAKATRLATIHQSFSLLSSGEHPVVSLPWLEDNGMVKVGRGRVISRRDIVANPGGYPVYSSAGQNGGEFGRYSEFMFDEEMITWSVDGGGHLFYRPKHRFSVTNVGGWMRVLDSAKLDTKYLFLALSNLHSKHVFDWSRKAHPSVIRLLYTAIPFPPLDVQKQVAAEIERLIANLDNALEMIDGMEGKGVNLHRSLLHSAFSGTLTARWRESHDG
jgi:restriction endonuclease S subunit